MGSCVGTAQYRKYGPVWALFVQRRKILLHPLLLNDTLSGVTISTQSLQLRGGARMGRGQDGPGEERTSNVSHK